MNKKLALMPLLSTSCVNISNVFFSRYPEKLVMSTIHIAFHIAIHIKIVPLMNDNDEFWK